jgi:hypothetical protein
VVTNPNHSAKKSLRCNTDAYDRGIQMSKQSPTERGAKRVLWSSAITKAFPDYADLIERAVSENLRRYQRFGKWHMIWFRVTGFLEVVLSVSFPFVITFVNTQYPNYNITVLFTGISIAIALSAGISAFYSWRDNWRLFSTQRGLFRGVSC